MWADQSNKTLTERVCINLRNAGEHSSLWTPCLCASAHLTTRVMPLEKILVACANCKKKKHENANVVCQLSYHKSLGCYPCLLESLAELARA